MTKYIEAIEEAISDCYMYKPFTNSNQLDKVRALFREFVQNIESQAKTYHERHEFWQKLVDKNDNASGDNDERIYLYTWIALAKILDMEVSSND